MSTGSARGTIFDLQRFCTRDGPGIRTTAFLKGCPLSCPWCHNPEAMSAAPELLWSPALCCGCGTCLAACPTGARRAKADKGLELDRNRCSRCLACAQGCPSGALAAVGREASVAEVLAEVEADRAFYEESGGGMTLSGGEPAAQPEFARELLAGARAAGIDTCVETCGFGPAAVFESLVPLTGLFFWDLKDTDPARHLAGTGGELQVVLDNLRLVDSLGAPTVLRCILLAGHNLDEHHLAGIADVFAGLRRCRGVELLPYRPLGEAKSGALGRPVRDRREWQPGAAEVDRARDLLAGRNIPTLA